MERTLEINYDGQTIEVVESDGNKATLDAKGQSGSISCKDGSFATLEAGRFEAGVAGRVEIAGSIAFNTPLDGQPEKNINAIYEKQGFFGGYAHAIGVLLFGHTKMPMGDLESPLTPVCKDIKKALDR